MIILPVPPPPDSILYSDPSEQKRSPERLRTLRASFLFIKWSDLLCLFCPGRNAEQHKTDDEQDGNGAHTHVGAAGQLAAHADDHGAKEGGTLAADIEQAKVCLLYTSPSPRDTR